MWFIPYLAVMILIIVNGMTDAPNAVTCCIVTKSLSYGKTIFLAGICNFAGCLVTSIIGGRVAEFTYSLAGFGEGNTSDAVTAFTAGIIAVIIWSIVAWYFGIPTSESHGLLAAVSGAAIAFAVKNRAPISSAVDFSGWGLVFVGLLLSTFPPYICAGLFRKYLQKRHENKRKKAKKKSNNAFSENQFWAENQKEESFYANGQIVTAALNAFLHGAQDGQKFVGILLLLLSLSGSRLSDSIIPTIITSTVISIGTVMGGRKIIKHMGEDLVTLDKRSGFCADVSAAAFLGLCVFIGLPVSTTHAKSCAMMGAGEHMDKKVVKELIVAWILTFPICALIAFGLTYAAI